MTQKTILFVNRVGASSEGATGRVMQEAIHAFRAAGWHADYIAAQVNSSSLHNYALAWVQLFRQVIRAPRADIIVFMTDPPLLIWQILFWPFAPSTKLVQWCHDLYPDLLPVMGYRFPDWLVKILQRMSTYAMNRTNAVIAIGRCMKDRLVANGVDAARIVVIPNWAPQQLHPLPYVPTEPLQILYAGNFGLNHPFHAILTAAEHFKNDDRLQFVFSGRGKKRAQLSDTILSRNLKNCSVQDFVPDDQLNDVLSRGALHVTSMSDAALGLLVPCKIYSAPAVGRYSLFLGPLESEAALFITDNNLGAALPNDGTALITFLEQTLADRSVFDQKIAALQPPLSSLPQLVTWAERML